MRRLTGFTPAPKPAAMPEGRRYSVVVAKDYLKFAAAHFIAYPGFREPLHGHNYQVSVKIEADLGPDGYVLDFGLVKRVAKALCEELDERVLVPERSDCLRVAAAGGAVEVTTETGEVFRFPAADVRLLPIAHSSAEEIASYLLGRLREALRGEAGGRGLAALEVGVAEAPGQVAYCREAF
jgi:6-pyruvoyl-tetrahydropterin synthase